MRKESIWVVLALATVLAGCAPDRSGDYEVATLLLPDGHVDAGREVYVELGCVSCHGVARDADLPVPVSANLGPLLGPAQSHYSSGGLATAIIAPSHYVPADMQEGLEDERSPMGDYTEAMTVRQLADVIAYIQSQAGENVTQLPPGVPSPPMRH